MGSLYKLRIPRLQLQVQGWASILGVLGALDVLLFGNYTVSTWDALHIFFSTAYGTPGNLRLQSRDRKVDRTWLSRE